MPIYEYKCNACTHVSSFLVHGFKDPEGLTCEQCGHTGLTKVISTVNYHGSHADRLSGYSSQTRKSDGFFKDTRNIGLEAERMLKKAGVEPTDDFKSKLERARSDPGSVLKDYKP